jgi:hypothetical protein
LSRRTVASVVIVTSVVSTLGVGVNVSQGGHEKPWSTRANACTPCASVLRGIAWTYFLHPLRSQSKGVAHGQSRDRH